MQYMSFDCGCRFPMLENGRIQLDIENVPFNCQRTWFMLGQGLTKGVFQLESPLGRQWCKKLKPENIEHLAALGAILRPGVLRALDENKVSMTEHYCRRKNGEEPVEYFHPSIKPILESTYGVQIYQEQAMQIAQIVAGFNLQTADELRKAIGKKLPEEMAKVKTKFLEGAKQRGIVTEAEARQMFDWIEQSQRYSFNKSHAVSYAIDGYHSAYCKAHFPIPFFTSYLYHSQEKQDPKKEVRELINEAHLMNIDVLPPDITNLEPHFHTDGTIITFGLTDIKGIGEAVVTKINKTVKQKEVEYNKPLSDWSWFDVLIKLGPIKAKSAKGRIGESVMASLISVGALRNFSSNRSKMLAELKVWTTLSEGEALFIINNSDKYKSLAPALRACANLKKDGGGCHGEDRKEIVRSELNLLENPASKLEDSPNWIAGSEEKLLGIAITCSRIDTCDKSAVNTTCRDFAQGNINNRGTLILGVEIQSIQEVKTRNGKNPGQKMARLVITDGSCAIDAVCWPDTYKEIKGLLTPQNTVIVQGERDRKQGSLVIKKAWQATDNDNN